ncbi:MAG: YcjF family protein [Marivita sp.]|uniref:YcjF family protein n=1 Tax=Marivita sp. TaxID=2003365 RepID=UPI003EF9B783
MAMTEQVISNDVHAQAARVISSAVKWSAAAAIVPIPVVDLIALGAVQVKMVRDLAHVYGVDADSETLQSVVSALLGTLASATISGGLLGSSLKVVPVGGTILGSVGLAAFGSAATYAIGKIFVAHFEKGSTVSSFSAEAVEAELKQEFAAAKAKT